MVHFSKFVLPKEKTEEIMVKRGHETIRYLNIPCSFDIETSSFYDADHNKRATMYIWMMGIDDQIVYGRTWGEFQYFLAMIHEAYELGFNRRMVVYIHNLGYEFQFLINHVQLTQTFARKKRHPIKALADDGFELRCSMFLSGLSLENTAKELKAKKQVGSLDYTKLRHSGTPLSDEEMKYCEYDIKVLLEFISREMKKCGDITKIPLTKTGYVREYCRKHIETNYNYKSYRYDILKEFPDKDTFILLYKAFAGGFTHANFKYLFEDVENVHSIDFTSSYPAQMIMHKYPRGRFSKLGDISMDRFNFMIQKYACVFEIKISNVKSKTSHHIWSSSKCDYGTNEIWNAIIDNGRIVKSDCIYTRMTDVDYKIFKMFYDFKDEDVEIHNFMYTTYGYLPKPIIECILKFYSDKTSLKDVVGMEDFYLVAKGMLNAIYGMMVTNPVNDDIVFDLFVDDPKKIWSLTKPTIEDALDKVKNSPKTFLCYQWGVWVTAWARYELLRAVKEFGEDVIYCDTDSIKFLNYEKHEAFMKKQNEEITEGLLRTIKYFKLDPKALNPKDIYGKEHQLGIWSYEGMYDKFRTLGAKRYMVEKKGRLKATISGLNTRYIYREDVENNLDTPLDKLPKNVKEEFGDFPRDKWLDMWEKKYRHSAMQYIIDKGGLEYFADEMFIPKEYSKRLTHTYIEDYFRMNIRDYCDIAKMVEEYCYIHLEPSDFKLSLAEEFIKFLKGEGTAVKRVTRSELAINMFQKELLKRNGE